MAKLIFIHVTEYGEAKGLVLNVVYWTFTFVVNEFVCIY